MYSKHILIGTLVFIACCTIEPIVNLLEPVLLAVITFGYIAIPIAVIIKPFVNLFYTDV